MMRANKTVAAGSVKLGTEIGLDDGVGPIPSRPSKLGARIMEILADGKPWRSKHLVERAAEGVTPRAVQFELKLLLHKGCVTKPRLGVWLLAGMPAPAEADIPLLRMKSAGGPIWRKVLDRLLEPTSAPTLHAELGLSRQRVGQMLKVLLAEGKVRRVPEFGTYGRWLWMRSELDVKAAMSRRPPILPAGRADVLNALEPDAFHGIRSVGKALGKSASAVGQQVSELEARGLAVSFKLGQQRYVGMTPLGLEHPSRGPGVRAPAADLTKAFGEKRRRFLETLAVLGPARTTDITAALTDVEHAGAGPMSGPHVALLVKTEFAERIPGTPGTHPYYRLTETGRWAVSLVSRHRPSLDRNSLKARIRSYRVKRPAHLRASLPYTPRQQAILDALAAGPLSTGALGQVIAGLPGNPKSLYAMLHAMAVRKAIRLLGIEGRRKMWALYR